MASSSSRKTLSDPAAVFPQESSDRLLDDGLHVARLGLAAPLIDIHRGQHVGTGLGLTTP